MHDAKRKAAEERSRLEALAGEQEKNKHNAVYCRPCNMWLNGNDQFETHLYVIETLEEYKDCFTRASKQTKNQFVVVSRRGEDIDVGGKRVTKDRFLQSVQFVDVDRTRGTL